MSDLITHQPTIEVDLALLNAASRQLEDAGFTVIGSRLPELGARWLLAENSLFVMGIAATRTLRDLVLIEGFAADALSELTRSAGPKRWDSYLVLLAREDKDARGTRAVRDLQYDTQQFRRIVNLGVQPDAESVQRALRPFLPLPVISQAILQPPLQDLISELELQGIDRGLLMETFQAYDQHAGA
jgi:hypothetical protein